ncbi:cytochrome P450 4c3-like [Belonocnema kinseyi]|uniref:cytochrome P450 4c3-like n=1 Tax=Belonocnema kinseyi TaxID=2817044 RepID=UPI00143DD885|nr:cytochrome P450 4c3-like [Belonocnema kinseyi]
MKELCLSDKWFHDRKNLTPAFHFDVVDQCTETMSEKAEVMVKCIEDEIKENPGKPIDFYVHSLKCAIVRNMFNQQNPKTALGKRPKKALLDLMLDLNENEIVLMTDEDIPEQVKTFMFAGHDTTASALNWAIFNLGSNPDVQEKLHQELDQVFRDSKEPATMQQIAELTYHERVIKENLRLNPSVPLVARRLTENLELDGKIIPKGVNATLHIMPLHRDPEFWPDPWKFVPDRFLPENCKGRHPYSYVPFSAGPRNCIGIKFAVAEQKIVLIAILRKWRVRSVRTQEKMKLQAQFILFPHEGKPVYFTPK